MTALEYMEKQIQQHRISHIQAVDRNAPEEMLENIRRKISYYEEAVEALRKVGATDNNVGCKWIPVSERLPEKDGNYLVLKRFGKHHWCDVHTFAKDGRKVDKYDFEHEWENVWFSYDSEWGYITSDNVTHWMPLPEPTKEV